MNSIIKSTCQKHPSIMKMFLKFYNQNDSFDEIMFHNVYSCILKNKIKLSNCGINYAQIKTFKDLLVVLESLVDIKFNFNIMKTKNELVEDLKNDNITIYSHEREIQIDIDDYILMSKYGSKDWCISKSENYFNKYRKKGNFIIVFKFNQQNQIIDKQCLTIKRNKKIYAAYDIDNFEVSNDYFYLIKYNMTINKHTLVEPKFNDPNHQVLLFTLLWGLSFIVFYYNNPPEGYHNIFEKIFFILIMSALSLAYGGINLVLHNIMSFLIKAFFVYSKYINFSVLTLSYLIFSSFFFFISDI